MKRLFAKKTENIKNEDTKKYVQLFKDLQTYSEKMAKQARKVKQILKDSSDIEDPQKIQQAAKELLQKNDSFLDTYANTLANLIEIVAAWGTEGLITVLSKSKPILLKAVKLSKNVDFSQFNIANPMSPTLQAIFGAHEE